MQTNQLVESIFVSVQWDCWRFNIPFAKPLAKQDVAVVSRSHLDHWHPNFCRKTVVLVPWRLKVPEPYKNLMNILRLGRSEHVRKLRFTCIDHSFLQRFINKPLPVTHAFWWLVAHLDVRVLFIGDMNVHDVNTAELFIDRLSEHGQRVHGMLLPSFGGALTHGATEPRQIQSLVRRLAAEMHDRDVLVGALPHPINADWGDYNATKCA